MRTGVDADTGKLLTGWDHCAQSIERVLKTRFGSRVLRRHLGSQLSEFQDVSASNRTLLALYVTIVEALEKGEPAFVVQTIDLVEGARSGRFAFVISGLFYPFGHLGDFSTSQNQTLTAGVA